MLLECPTYSGTIKDIRDLLKNKNKTLEQSHYRNIKSPTREHIQILKASLTKQKYGNTYTIL